MNILTRRNSNKSIDGEGKGSALGRTVSAERQQDAGKPSLLRRLSRTLSRSQEKPDQRENEHLPTAPAEHHHAGTVSPKVSADKVVEPVVNTLSRVESHHSVNSPADVLHEPSPQQTISHEQVSATTGDTKSVSAAHENTTTTPTKLQPHSSSASKHKAKHPTGLTKADIHHLFSGAPQFLLEKGRRGRYFPQAFFPWNNELEISDLQDRRFLRHESFALATLHAHLPIPDEVNWRPGMAAPVKKVGLETGKRPMFELGIFERPNMLGMEGREPGTVGMRYFLERPVADGLHDEKIKEHGKDVEIDLPLSSLPNLGALKTLVISDNEEATANIGKHAPEQDRARLVHGGPHAWKSVGVRNISMKDITERLESISQWRDKVANMGLNATLLDWMRTEELHHHLFSEFLYPPHKVNPDAKHIKNGLKIQIEALVKVLTTPGAWLDLSVPEARLRFGKILHSRTTKYDHETGMMSVNPERKWLLIQLLLAVELVIRLDTALRLGIAMHSDNFELSSDEIHDFNRLRNLKVDWDLVAAWRFLMLCYVKKVEKRLPSPSPDRSASDQLSRVKSPERHGLLGGLRHTLGLDDEKSQSTLDECDLAILPRQPRVMLDGLVRFAHNIGWPRWQEIQERLEQKLCREDPEEREKFLLDIMSCAEAAAHEQRHAPPGSPQAPGKITPSLEKFCVNLHPATATTIGGWLSHSWLSGMILPGTSICDILIATLLENDTDPTTLQHLGSRGLPLRNAGFVLNGSSWWSKSSIVGRVMAPLHGSKECMGWIYLPHFVPLNEATSGPVENRWVKVKTWPVPTMRDRPRIFDGDRLSTESSPLGIGKGNIIGSEFSMVTDRMLDNDTVPAVKVNAVKLHLSSTNATESSPDHPLAAWAQFDLSIFPAGQGESTRIPKQIRYGLDRAVYFVTAYPCRLPHGHATFKPGSHHDQEHHQHRHEQGQEQEQEHETEREHHHPHPHLLHEDTVHHPRHKPAEHLPAHPLHKTYKFVTKTLWDLIDNPTVDPPASGTASHSEVWVVDARESVTAPEPKHGHLLHHLHQHHHEHHHTYPEAEAEPKADAVANQSATLAPAPASETTNPPELNVAVASSPGPTSILSPSSPSPLSSALQHSLSWNTQEDASTQSPGEVVGGGQPRQHHHLGHHHTAAADDSSPPDLEPQLWRKDIFVRAWCAEKGRNALIARVGRTCLSCAIREAKALEIGVIVRVGVKEEWK
ncbi:hypothetical protein ABEF95_011880 [Exophiala dermatitidis]